MRILAIDTSSRTVSVALLDGDVIVMALDSESNRDDSTIEYSSLRAGADDIVSKRIVKPHRNRRASHKARVFPPGASSLLAPMIKRIFDQTGQSIQEIELIALPVGPGLFTGLRVGVVTAKSLAYATGAHVLGVNTLEVIAAQTAAFAGDSGLSKGNSIRVVLNAQRRQLFCGHYLPESGYRVKELETNQILDRDQWLTKINSERDLVTGAGLTPLVEDLKARFPDVHVAPKTSWECTATSVGRLAWQKFQSGKRDDLWKLKPFYFRPSAAEEKRATKL